MEGRTTEVEIEYPDILASQASRGGAFETSEGIQFSISVPKVIKCGERAQLKLILQNALDVPIKGEVKVEVPTTKFFKKTFLSTLPTVPFHLNPIEVISLDIPIQTQRETQEGEYDLRVKVRGVSIGKGNRVRGKKRGKDWGKAITKSIALSALLLPLGGVYISTPTDTLKGTLKIAGYTERVDTSILEPVMITLFSKDDIQTYRSTYKWLSQCLLKYKGHVEFTGFVAEYLQDKIKHLFQEKGILLSGEENLWISMYIAAFYINIISGMFEKMALDVTQKIRKGVISPVDLSIDVSCFNEIAIKPVILGLSSSEIQRLMLMIAAVGAARVIRKEFPKQLIQNIVKIMEEKWKEGTQNAIMEFICRPILLQAIADPLVVFFTNDAAINHLSTLVEVLKSYPKPYIDPEAVVKRREQLKLSISESRNSSAIL